MMRRERPSIIIAAVIFLVLSVMYVFVPSDPVSKTIQRVVYSVDNWFQPEIGGEEIASSNRLDELESENSRLRKQLNFKTPNDKQPIAAKVVAKSVQNYRSTIDIGAGEDQGIALGDSVLNDGLLVGRVIEVFSNRARIMTLADPDFRAAAVITGSKIEGLVRTVPGGTILEQVPSEKATELIGERVTTSGLGGLFPPGLMIGKLGDDISYENAIFRQFNLLSTSRVGVIEEVVVLIK